ncbi:MAG: MmgE/PrpD family protein [Deltaproteobacteria bacterium]|nr:MmgE/PrpD family protein [Deltaproteobacteria bacterium]
MSLNRELSAYIWQSSFDDLPPQTIEKAKHLILDVLGVGIAGWQAPGCREVIQTISSWNRETQPGATIITHDLRAGPGDAAFVNSTMMHALDFDDTLDSSALHTMVSVFPAALALGEVSAASGRQLLTATILGVDIICRLASAINTPLSWIRTATCGSFGAAAAAAKILDLPLEQIQNTLGIVYSQTAGNAQCLVDGSLVKRMQPAFAARAGVFSAKLAQNGITGATSPFTGEYGFFNLYEGGKCQTEKVSKDLGQHFGIMDLSLKPYPSCRMTHGAIDAALALQQSHSINADKIEQVTITASTMVAGMVGRPFQLRTDPQVDAQFSIPYTVAVALERGKPRLKDFSKEQIGDPKIQELVKKIVVIPSTNLPENDISSISITITTKNDRTFTLKHNHLLGSPTAPMSSSACREKFDDCLSFSERDDMRRKSSAIVDLVFKLEEIDNLQQLTTLL